MKLKSGKELSQFEIKKRLNTMGINYNSDIIGKNYYINLYDEAILSNSNIMKIKNDLDKDQMYTDFYNKKLRKINECSLRISDENKNINDNNAFAGNLFSGKNNGKKGFFSDYDDSLMKKICVTKLTLDFVDANEEYINKIGKAFPKVFIPFQALKKYTLLNIYPEIIVKLNKFLDILNGLIDEKFFLISIILFLILIIIIFLVLKKRKINDGK